jgi:hypothetical protein
MSTTESTEELSFGDAAEYCVVVAGTLTSRVLEWLDDHRVEGPVDEQESNTTIFAFVHDQVDLNGLLNTLYQLHLTILSIQRVTRGQHEKVTRGQHEKVFGQPRRTDTDTTEPMIGFREQLTSPQEKEKK